MGVMVSAVPVAAIAAALAVAAPTGWSARPVGLAAHRAAPSGRDDGSGGGGGGDGGGGVSSGGGGSSSAAGLTYAAVPSCRRGCTTRREALAAVPATAAGP